MEIKRETLGSRLGFLLLSVGCAVGLGNVWRFPYVVGKYGGGIFVLLYLMFLVVMGFPLLVMELSAGRAGKANLIGSIRNLSGNKRRWVLPARIVFSGNLLLMMYYTTITGWLIAYAVGYICGKFEGFSTVAQVSGFFQGVTSSPLQSVTYMLIGVAISAFICGIGLRKGVEKSVKFMMLLLFLLLALLAVKALTMPGAAKGVNFYLRPDWDRFSGNIVETVFAAMGQAFFTLSIGVGSMAIFGSYIGRERSLAGESTAIILLDTMIAIIAGFIIFPVCFSFGVAPDSGPNLVFVSLPHVFSTILGGRWWGALFFIFLSLAALTTVVAVFENIIAFLIDECHLGRKSAAAITGAGVALLSLPCVFGFNIWKDHQPLGAGSNYLDLEDFIVSQNLLPLGALTLVLFCTAASGWKWENFLAEANAGNGWKMPCGLKWYCRYVLPLLIVAVLVLGYYGKFF